MSAEHELATTVRQHAPMLLTFGEPDVSRYPSPGKWSAKQIIGHLIDSAANNHRRFVIAQFTNDLVFKGYDQEAWVSAQRYQDESWPDLVALWQCYNLHLAHLIASIPAEVRHSPREKHNLDILAWRPVPTSQPVSLEYFVNDYAGHLKHHLDQVYQAVRQSH